MLPFTSFVGAAYYGQRAGEELKRRLENAKHSIKIVSPYLSQQLIDILIAQAAQGVDVTLVTSTEIENRGLNIYQNFIKQHQITDEEALQKFHRFSAFCKAGVIVFAVAVIARFLFKFSFSGFNYVLLALFGGLLFAGYYRKKIRTFSYTYHTPFRFKAVASPNTDRHLMNDNRCALIHSKIFIIDGTLYTGSVNLTQAAFWYNYETLLTSIAPEAVKTADEAIENFFSSEYFYARTPEGIGPRIYRERLNPLF